ncbi:MAG: Peptidase M15D vanX D-ala-D-ala dipeptidase [candidate division TM6 bacterium GW2011_GWF2_38_10]|nr:MAG: Peptidase M15D vanX D-ala-D-ala dipeptidase [candidate division TM6 bacterium GW2011_GWF2_38_10]
MLLQIILALFLCTHAPLFGATNKEPLVEIKSINATINVDTSFINKTTKKSTCFLRKTVAQKLSLVQQELGELGLGLKIMDAYRPLAEQRKLWEKFPDNRYVANPAHGSRHNRGAAVDVRLIRIKDHKELSMPTMVFSSACHRNYPKMKNEEMKKNCKLLELIMQKHGFIPLPTEWWHFDYKEWAKYEVLDIPIERLAHNEQAICLQDQKTKKATPLKQPRTPTKKRRPAPKKVQKKA